MRYPDLTAPIRDGPALRKVRRGCATRDGSLRLYRPMVAVTALLALMMAACGSSPSRPAPVLASVAASPPREPTLRTLDMDPSDLDHGVANPYLFGVFGPATDVQTPVAIATLAYQRDTSSIDAALAMVDALDQRAMFHPDASGARDREQADRILARAMKSAKGASVSRVALYRARRLSATGNAAEARKIVESLRRGPRRNDADLVAYAAKFARADGDWAAATRLFEQLARGVSRHTLDARMQLIDLAERTDPRRALALAVALARDESAKSVVVFSTHHAIQLAALLGDLELALDLVRGTPLPVNELEWLQRTSTSNATPQAVQRAIHRAFLERAKRLADISPDVACHLRVVWFSTDDDVDDPRRLSEAAELLAFAQTGGGGDQCRQRIGWNVLLLATRHHAKALEQLARGPRPTRSELDQIERLYLAVSPLLPGAEINLLGILGRLRWLQAFMLDGAPSSVRAAAWRNVARTFGRFAVSPGPGRGWAAKVSIDAWYNALAVAPDDDALAADALAGAIEIGSLKPDGNSPLAIAAARALAASIEKDRGK